jgi:hypothetical protein
MRSQGEHLNKNLSLIQKGFIEYVESVRPDQNEHTAAELTVVRSSIDKNGCWEEWEEWRISTSFNSRIEREDIEGKTWFKVSVECDGQQFTCRSPSLEKAYLVSKFYRRVIVDQFYSVGPPWA